MIEVGRVGPDLVLLRLQRPEKRNALSVGLIERLTPMKNVFSAGEQYHRFSIDPLAQIEAEKSADDAGQVVLGYYHSHPDHPARPSEYDRTHVPPWSFYGHIIVAIEKGRPAAMTAWVMDEETEQFAPLELIRE